METVCLDLIKTLLQEEREIESEGEGESEREREREEGSEGERAYKPLVMSRLRLAEGCCQTDPWSPWLCSSYRKIGKRFGSC